MIFFFSSSLKDIMDSMGLKKKKKKNSVVFRNHQKIKVMENNS